MHTYVCTHEYYEGTYISTVCAVCVSHEFYLLPMYVAEALTQHKWSNALLDYIDNRPKPPSSSVFAELADLVSAWDYQSLY